MADKKDMSVVLCFLWKAFYYYRLKIWGYIFLMIKNTNYYLNKVSLSQKNILSFFVNF